jgi:hypothetical protein
LRPSNLLLSTKKKLENTDTELLRMGLHVEQDNTKNITKAQFKVFFYQDLGVSTLNEKLFFHPDSYCGPHCKAENSFMIRKYETQNNST